MGEAPEVAAKAPAVEVDVKVRVTLTPEGRGSAVPEEFSRVAVTFDFVDGEAAWLKAEDVMTTFVAASTVAEVDAVAVVSVKPVGVASKLSV